MIGQTIAGRYELEGILGSGGRGVVFRGRDTVLGRQVAVKILRGDLGDKRAESRFRREAQTAARLEHPAIVPIYDFGRSRNGAFLVMPRVHGESLSDVIDSGVLGAEDVIEIGAQAADALVYSHSCGVVHRDIKPGNFMVERFENGWRVRLLDFGIALDFGAERLTDDVGLLGTPLYLSPEQVLEEPVDARSDLYALGVVLYECLAGRPPITGRLHRLIQKIVSEEPESLGALGVDLVPALDELIMTCLAKKRTDRPADARQVRDRLRALQGPPELALAPRSKEELSRRPTAIVGRTAELRTASRSLAAASTGRGQLLLVGGDSGIGKSTYLRELERLASAEGVRCIHGRFVERRENSFPYHGFCSAILDFFRAGGGRTQRQPGLEGLAANLLKLFPMLEDVPQIVEAAGSESAGEMSKSMIFETLARTFSRLAGSRPLVLLLEDLHQADVSVEALQYLFRRLSAMPVLIVAAFETPLPAAHAIDALLAWCSGEPEARRLQLGPLSREDVERLLKEHLGEAGVDAETFGVLYRTSGGHPLFIAHLVRCWLDSEALALDDAGRWSLVQDKPAEQWLPDSMRSMLEKRLRGLDSAESELVEALAVIGLRARRSELAALAGLANPAVAGALRELVSRGFLIQQEREISFANAALREMVYRNLAEEKRQRLHCEFARVLELEYSGRLERVSFRLAHHWNEGHRFDRATLHLKNAADQALSGRSPDDAVELAERILALCDAGEPSGCALRGEALSILARAHLESDRHTQAVAVAHRAREEDLAGSGTMLAGAEAAWASGQLELAASLAASGLEDDGGGKHRGPLIELRAKIKDLLRDGPVSPTETAAKASRAVMEREARAVDQDRGLSSRAGHEASLSFERLGEALLIQGEYLAARDAFESAYQRRLVGGRNDEAAAQHLVRLAELALKLGHYGEALDYCDRGREASADPLQKANHDALAGLVCCSAGDFEEASRRVARGFDHLVDAAGLGGERRSAVEALLQRTRGNIWVGLGDPGKALGHYREALDLLERSQAGAWDRSIALFNLGEALTHLGEDEEALGPLEQAFVEKSAIGDRWGLAYVHHAKAGIFRRRGELEAAEREAAIGIEIAGRIGDPKIEAMLLIELGRISSLAGDHAAAERRLFRALRRAEEASARTEVRIARSALNQLREAAPDAVGRHRLAISP